MLPNEKQEFERMKQELALLSSVVKVSGNRVIIKKTVVIDGAINADKVFTQRSGSYAELTT